MGDVTQRTKYNKGRGHPADWSQLLLIADTRGGKGMFEAYDNMEREVVVARVYLGGQVLEDMGYPDKITLTVRSGDQMENELAIPSIAGDPVSPK